MTPRYAKPGEALALMPGHLHTDRRGMFWMLGSGPIRNERRGDVMIVSVRGELEHHEADSYGCAESYEGIRQKMAWAFCGQVDGDSDADDAPATPPKAIVMVIDSPGGVVSGLNETVKAIQKMRTEHPGVRVVAYCNEMAASAAYAIACACERIVAPPSAIVGSVGVISTMVSQARKDVKDGFDVRLLTSGARKADGHPHAPLSDAAVNVEQGRVTKLADAFFRLVSKARGIAISKIRALEAGIYLGKDAVGARLVDEVKSLDDVIAEADAKTNVTGAAASGGNKTDRRLNMNLAGLIKRTEAAIKKENDPGKLSALYATLAGYKTAEKSVTKLAGYKKVEKHVEDTKTEESSEEEEEEEAAKKSEEDEEEASAKSEGDEDEKKAAKAGFGDDEDNDEDDDDDKDEKKSAKAAIAFRAAVEQLTGKKGKRAMGALHARMMAYEAMAKDVATLKQERSKDLKASLIAGARGKFITRADATWLAKQPLSIVKDFIEDRQANGYIVNTEDSMIVKPKQAKPGTEESLPPNVLEMINQAVAAVPGSPDAQKAFRAKLVATHLAEHTENISAALNGAGRY